MSLCSIALYDLLFENWDGALASEWALGPGNTRFARQRVAFNGNCRECCLNSYDRTRAYADCFTNTGTCSQECRYGSKFGCQNIFIDTCVNASGGDFNRAWFLGTQPFCTTMASQNIYNSTGEFTAENIPFIQAQMMTVFQRAFPNGFTEPGSSFQNNISGFCKNNPEACAPALTKLCENYTVLELSTQPNISKLCGCYLPPIQYARSQNLFGLPRQCQPICNTGDAVRYINPQTYQQEICTNSTCIIDNITINLLNSTAGNINLTQFCSSCGISTPCSCRISDVNISVVDAALKNITLDQKCGSSVDCYAADPNNPNGPAIKVNCTTGVPEEETKQTMWLTIISSVVGGLIIIFFIIWLILRVKLQRQKKNA